MGDLPCFDELKALAEADPKAFDRFRQNVCEEFINSIPRSHQRRLHGMQFRINHEIRRAKTPLAGVIKVSSMMHDSLYELSEHLHELKEYALAPADQWPEPTPPRPPAEVVYLEQWQRGAQRRH